MSGLSSFDQEFLVQIVCKAHKLLVYGKICRRPCYQVTITKRNLAHFDMRFKSGLLIQAVLKKWPVHIPRARCRRGYPRPINYNVGSSVLAMLVLPFCASWHEDLVASKGKASCRSMLKDYFFKNIAQAFIFQPTFECLHVAPIGFLTTSLPLVCDFFHTVKNSFYPFFSEFF